MFVENYSMEIILDSEKLRHILQNAGKIKNNYKTIEEFKDNVNWYQISRFQKIINIKFQIVFN